MLILCSVAAVALATAFIIMNHIHTPQRTVEEYLDALDREDYSKIKSMTSCKEVGINKESLTPFVTLYKEDETFRNTVYSLLKSDQKKYENHKTVASDKTINLIAKNHIFYRTYKIRLSAYTVEVTTNLDQVTVCYGSDTFDLPTKDSIAYTNPLLPGTYNFEATYTNPYTEELLTCSKDLSLTDADPSVSMDFSYATLNFTIPKGYSFNSVTIGSATIKDLDPLSDGSYQISPVICDTSITITCTSSWGSLVSTSFAVPEEYIGKTYSHDCDFSSTSMDFEYPDGLKLKSLSINGKEVKNLKKYANTKNRHIVLSDLTIGTKIKCSFITPWNETLTYKITLTKKNIGTYNQQIKLPMSAKTIDSLTEFAGNYYLNLIKYLNQNDMEKLEQLSTTDELANDFYSMLSNIQYDYDNYAADYDNFKESLSFKPVSVTIDRKTLTNYSNNFEARIHGVIKTKVTSMDYDKAEPITETTNCNYDETLYLYYDTEKKNWAVSEGYYDYTGVTFSEPVKIK